MRENGRPVPGVGDGVSALSWIGSAGWGRASIGALTLLLGLGTAGCGRRGPPLPPLQVEPETAQLLPLREERGQILIRWYAPRLSSGGDVEELRLRRAIVSYRVVDIHLLVAEERAAQRAGEEDTEEEESGEAPPEDEAVPEPPESESTETQTVEEATSDPEVPGTVELAPEGEPPAPVAEIALTTEPEGEAGETLPDEAPPVAEGQEEPAAGELPAEESDPGPGEAPEEPGTTEPEGGEPDSEGAAEPPEPEGDPEPEEGEPDSEGAAQPEGDPAEGGEPDSEGAAQPREPEGDPEPEEGEPDSEGAAQPPEPEGDPEAEEGEPDSEGAAQPPEPEDDPEPAGVLLDYDDLEFEALSEVDSEVLGEERVLELPVDPEWIGRRLEIRVRYEARGGASEESEPQSLDVTGPLPPVREVSVEVGPQALTVRWLDPRDGLESVSALTDPIFEVFRRREGPAERLGRSFGPTLADSEVIWGQAVCYSARLVMAGGDDERTLPDPGPDSASGDIEAKDGTEAPGFQDPEVEGVARADPSQESTSPNEDPASSAPEALEAAEAPWSPIPIRVSGTGSSALSVGPLSAEACVTPVDVFPPLPPSDLRLFWRAEQTELSWSESVSQDVVGYHVYRSGPDGSGFERLTESPSGQTTFGDGARDPRGAFRYAVTAIDGADPPNESLPSESRRANPR